MESRFLLSFISSRLKSVEKQLHKFEQDRKLDRLHQIRVDIKKTRAILSFVEKIYKEKFGPDPLKNLFKKAGEIRQFQITMELLESISFPPKTVIQNLKLKQDVIIKAFLLEIPNYLKLVSQFREKYFFDLLIPSQKNITKYFNSRRMKANRSFNCRRRSKMHHFRKLLKKIMYVYDILPKKMKRHLELKGGLINKVQNEIGEWHDTYAAIDFLILNNADRKDNYIAALNQVEAKQFDNLFKQFPGLKI